MQGNEKQTGNMEITVNLFWIVSTVRDRKRTNFVTAKKEIFCEISLNLAKTNI